MRPRWGRLIIFPSSGGYKYATSLRSGGWFLLVGTNLRLAVLGKVVLAAGWGKCAARAQSMDHDHLFELESV